MIPRRRLRDLACAALAFAGLAGCGSAPPPRPVIVATEPPGGNVVAVPRTNDAPQPEAHERRRASPGAKRGRSVVEGALGLYVGQPIEAAEQLVGGTVSHVTFDAEESAWNSSGYITGDEPIFAIGFDAVSEFAQPKLPVYKIYAARGLVRVIKFSAYVVDGPALDRKVGFDPSCFLLGPPEGATETFGAATYVEDVPDRGRVVYHFVESGLSVLAEDASIQVFDVFGSLSPPEERRVRDALSRKATRTEF